jgi:hypothetical protein
MAFELQSAAFQPGGAIPVKHTCDGPNVSPRLRWTGPPANTKSFALVVDDPDAPAGTWVHWVLYDIPPTAGQVAEDVAAQDKVAGVGTQGVNDFGKVGYGGPCPPRGPAHRYVFTLYALDAALRLPARQTKAELSRAMEGHLLGRAELIGRYRRK